MAKTVALRLEYKKSLYQEVIELLDSAAYTYNSIKQEFDADVSIVNVGSRLIYRIDVVLYESVPE